MVTSAAMSQQSCWEIHSKDITVGKRIQDGSNIPLSIRGSIVCNTISVPGDTISQICHSNSCFLLSSSFLNTPRQ